MSIERVVFEPSDGFLEHLKKQGIDYQVEYNKWSEYIDHINFIKPKNYKEYKGIIGLSEIFREVGKKKWEAQ